MLVYIVKRVLGVIPVLLCVSLLVFGFLRAIPGDPALIMLGERATQENINRVREQLGLNKPLYQQYLTFLGNALRGDLGTSIIRQEAVAQQIVRRFPATLELALAAMTIALIIGIPAGIISAVRRGTWFDTSSMLVALTGVSMPIFWLGLMLIFLFSVTLHLLPTGGRLPAGSDYVPVTNLILFDSLLRGDLPTFYQGLRHLALPAIALATIPMAIIARMTRSSMLEMLNQDYVRTAHAKGLKHSTVIIRHTLRNAWLPIITVVGLQVGRLLGGAILTETVFSWPGIGRWLVDAIYARDYPIVQGVTLFLAILFVTVNLLIDVLYAVADPRIRLS